MDFEVRDGRLIAHLNHLSLGKIINIPGLQIPHCKVES